MEVPSSSVILKPVEVSYASRNSTSMYLCIIIILGFVIFSVSTVGNTYNKLYPDLNVQHLDITKAPFYSLSDVLNRFANSYIDISSNFVKNYNADLATFNNIKRNNAGKILTLINPVSTDDTTYNSLSGLLDNMKTIVTNLNTLQSANIVAMEKVYQGYQIQIQNYVNGLVNMLNNISTQIGKLGATPYKSLMTPLAKIYTMVRNTLVNNVDMIHAFYTNFNKTQIPAELTVKIPTVTKATNTAVDTFRRAGYY